MAALPFLITTATVAYVALFPPEEGRTGSPRVLSPSSRITVLNNPFLVGIGVGFGLSWLTSYELKRRRLWQRVRLKFLSWLYDSGVTTTRGEQRRGTPLLEKFRKPCRILHLDGTPIPRKSQSLNNCEGIYGTHLELVSPDWTLSSNLYCDVVTLPPGTELVSANAKGVEFFYVVEGDGIYVDQDGETHQISAEDGFIVDPGCNRGFLVGGTTNGLKLFRATDNPMSGGSSHLTSLRTSSLTSTVSIITAGVHKIYQFLEKQTSI